MNVLPSNTTLPAMIQNTEEPVGNPIPAPEEADPAYPLIVAYGAIHPMPDAAMRPDPGLDYKVAFAIRHAGEDFSKPNPGLDKVARFLNLLAADGIAITPGHVLVVIQGAATPLVLADAAYQQRYQHANHDLPLLQALAAFGVEVHVCGQALHGHGIAAEEVADSVIVDLSAMTTLATQQLRGWAVLFD